MLDREDVYIHRSLLVEKCGFTSSDLSKFLVDNDIPKEDGQGVSVYPLIAALNRARKKRKGADQEDDVDRELKLEKLQSERIKNRTRLGELIEKSYAKERVRKAFIEVATRMRYQIKQTAVKVTPVTNARDCEVLMTMDYNEVLSDLEKKAINQTWEEDGLQAKFGRTELASDTPEGSSSGSSEEDGFTV
jgi:hypothetical protein